MSRLTPRLTLHLLVLNGASVIERALRPLKGIIDEIVFTDTGSTDDTVPMLWRLASDLGCPCKAFMQSPMLHPEDYIVDSPSAFKLTFDGKFTGGFIPRDWALARNRSVGLASGQYVMKLDADDEVLRPEHIKPTLDFMDSRPDIDIVMSPYETMNGQAIEHTSMYSRLWRRKQEISFKGVCHENIDHHRVSDGSNWIMTPGGLTTRDWRDSIGQGIRPAYRNFKVLLAEFERRAARAEPVDNHLVLFLADEAASFLPVYALQLLDGVSELSPVDRMWMHVIAGLSRARLWQFSDAEREYAAAAALGSPRAALLRARLMAGRRAHGWRGHLESAISESQKKMWPFGASNVEVAEAREILAGKKALA